MAWYNVKHKDGNECCINLDEIRNIEKIDGICKAWFKNIQAYQIIGENDYKKIKDYFENVRLSSSNQLSKDAFLI